MLKQRLQQKLLQKLSPQQIQMIKLLEIPAAQLEQRIKKELEENPVLEEGRNEEESVEEDAGEKDTGEQDEFSLEDYIDDEDIPQYRTYSSNYSKDDDRKTEIPFSVGSSFHEALESQLGLRMLDEKQEALGKYILGNIDDDGYLRRDLEAISDDLAFSMNITVSEEELYEVLKIIQDLEPAGVGARNLRECLLLQLDRREELEGAAKLARKVLADHYNEFTRKHYEKIRKRMDVSEEELRVAIDEILKLNPKPGGAYADPMNKSAQVIIPDFLLEKNDEGLHLSLNAGNVPELRLSRSYAHMLQDLHAKKLNPNQDQKDALTFVKQKLDSAKWFIDAIRQRQNTLLLTMNAIIDYQREYFEEGEETLLRPMILKDIAERTNLDISTISRVANSKYIQTHFGIFPLKYFFSEGLQTDSGEEVSTREIKSILQEMIGGEDKKKPLTDDALAAVLQEKGYQIARRTVAKYREQLNIPVARLRKEA